MQRVLATMALLALVAVPATQATGKGTMSFPVDFTRFHMAIDDSTSGKDAAQMRAQVDAYGNHDGQATQAEGDKFAADFKAMIGQAVLSGTKDGNLTLDGAGPTSADLTVLQFRDIAGAISSEAPVTLHAEMDLAFAPGAGPDHTLFVKAHKDDSAGAQSVETTVKSPPGYVIKSIAGAPGAVLSSDNASATFTDTAQGAENGVVVFGKPAAKGAAGVTPLALLAAIAGLALVLRRRA
jgi:hypothetical protein